MLEKRRKSLEKRLAIVKSFVNYSRFFCDLNVRRLLREVDYDFRRMNGEKFYFSLECASSQQKKNVN